MASAPPADALLTQAMTIAEARRALAGAFRQAGLDSPDLDARLLAGHALALDHTGLAVQGERRLDAGEARRLADLAARRLRREPVARILGEKEFWGLPLRITDATLVPRPETETVVEAALAAIAGGSRARPLRIADLGVGSGAILLALLSELPHALGIGTDIDGDAVVAARGNAARHGLRQRAVFAVADFGMALRGGFDLVVSNPPYIPSADIAALAPEVRRDPRRALDGGGDGLAAYRAIVADATRLLAPGGHLVIELGIGQEAAVTALAAQAGLSLLPTRADLAGTPRALCARVATKTP